MSNRRNFSAEHQDPHAAEREHTVPAQELTDGRATDRQHDNLNWSRTSNLEAPPARPGYVQQWIRYEVGGKYDEANVKRKLFGTEGWRPRSTETVDGGYSPATTRHPSLGNIIAAAGMVLCERPERMQRQRDAFYKRKLDGQMDAVNHNLFREQHSAMPISRSHKTTVESVKRRIAADE